VIEFIDWAGVADAEEDEAPPLRYVSSDPERSVHFIVRTRDGIEYELHGDIEAVRTNVADGYPLPRLDTDGIKWIAVDNIESTKEGTLDA
jgi:hypothetical protein